MLVLSWAPVGKSGNEDLGVAPGRFETEKVLKRDIFGQIEVGVWHEDGKSEPAIRRLYTKNPIARPVALILANNEKNALTKLAPLAKATGQIPALLGRGRDFHVRGFIEAEVLSKIKEPLTVEFYNEAKAILRVMRRQGVCHNDLAKQANWLRMAGSQKPVLVDFQLALCSNNRRSKWFLTLCREDLRHLLKLKRRHFPVTAAEAGVLAKKALPTRIWMATGKKVYLFVTRGILGWEDRTGPEERDDSRIFVKKNREQDLERDLEKIAR